MAIQQPKLGPALRCALAALALTAALAPAARADERGRDVEALMGDYIRLWNAHDAHAIWDRIYRLDARSEERRVGKECW